VQSRRDQAQAYRFVLNRVHSALLRGEPDSPEPPLRRIWVATFASIMVAVLVVAGFGILGLLRPGGKQGWRHARVLVVERETGTRYVYDPADGALHPVLNYTSARLILNAPDITVQMFSRRSLADAPRGATRGLPNLPDALPDAAGLVRGPWTVCNRPSSPSPAVVAISVGFPAAGTRLGPGSALLVRASGDRQYLVWNDTRLEISNPRNAATALGFASAPIDVADTWVNAVPPGPDLAPPAVPDRGASTTYQVAGQQRRIGQVFKVPAEGGLPERYWLALANGLAPIADTAALLLLGDYPGEWPAYGNETPQAIPVQRADINAAGRSPTEVTPDGFPDTVPALANPPAGSTQTVCAAYADTSGSSTAVAISVEPEVPGLLARTGGPATGGSVLLPPGAAAVIRLLPHDGQDSDSIYLVADTGALYPVPSKDVLAVLGYGGVTPVPVPGGIVGLIPTGPALDPGRANAAVPVGTSPPSAPSGQPEGDGGA